MARPATINVSTLSPGRNKNAAVDVIVDMQRLGFTEYEARTYLSLLQVNPATAYEISKNSGLPRANTYGALENLVKKSAVQPISENPVRYAPVQPEVLLERLSSDVSKLCGRLKENLQGLEMSQRSDVVWSLDGREQIEKKINDLIDSAAEHVWIKASTDVLRQHQAQLKRAAKRGITLIFVVFGQDIDFLNFGSRSKVYLHEGNGIRIGGADNLFTIAIDYQVALTANVTDEITCAYTTNPSVVRMAETLIRHDFYMAEIMSEFGSEIQAKFGTSLVNLRRQMFSAQQYQQLEINLNNLDKAGLLPSSHAVKAKTSPRTTAKVASIKRPLR